MLIPFNVADICENTGLLAVINKETVSKTRRCRELCNKSEITEAYYYEKNIINSNAMKKILDIKF